jgi:hypothetical protein
MALGSVKDSMDRGAIVVPRFCASCLKAGCTSCYAVEGGVDCAFCEDRELCPTRKRMQERAQAARRSAEVAHEKAEAAAVERRKSPLACPHCDFVGASGSGIARHMSLKHGVKFVKKEKEKVMEGLNCPNCDAGGFATPQALGAHRRHSHPGAAKAQKKSGGANSAPASTEKSVTPRKPKVAKTPAKPANGDGTIQVTVNAAHLNDWWQGRTLAEKGEVFTNWLQVAR